MVFWILTGGASTYFGIKYLSKALDNLENKDVVNIIRDKVYKWKRKYFSVFVSFSLSNARAYWVYCSKPIIPLGIVMILSSSISILPKILDSICIYFLLKYNLIKTAVHS